MPDTPPSDAPRKRAAASGTDGREHGRVVRRYLGALETEKAAKGRKRGLEAIQNRLLKIDELLITADPLARLHLTQERIDLHAEVVRVTNGGDSDVSSIEADFVKVARAYGEYTGVTYAAWRQVGVETDVLDRAGIARTGTNHKGDGARPKPADKAEPAPEMAAAKARNAPPAPEAAVPDENVPEQGVLEQAVPEQTPAPAARPAAMPKKVRKAAPKGEAAPNPNSASMRRKRMAAGS